MSFGAAHTYIALISQYLLLFVLGACLQESSCLNFYMMIVWVTVAHEVSNRRYMNTDLASRFGMRGERTINTPFSYLCWPAVNARLQKKISLS